MVTMFMEPLQGGNLLEQRLLQTNVHSPLITINEHALLLQKQLVLNAATLEMAAIYPLNPTPHIPMVNHSIMSVHP